MLARRQSAPLVSRAEMTDQALGGGGGGSHLESAGRERFGRSQHDLRLDQALGALELFGPRIVEKARDRGIDLDHQHIGSRMARGGALNPAYYFRRQRRHRLHYASPLAMGTRLREHLFETLAGA